VPLNGRDHLGAGSMSQLHAVRADVSGCTLNEDRLTARDAWSKSIRQAVTATRERRRLDKAVANGVLAALPLRFA
jgi:hypothetical protein